MLCGLLKMDIANWVGEPDYFLRFNLKRQTGSVSTWRGRIEDAEKRDHWPRPSVTKLPWMQFFAPYPPLLAVQLPCPSMSICCCHVILLQKNEFTGFMGFDGSNFSTLTILILGGSSKPYLPVSFNFCEAKDSCRHSLACSSAVRLNTFLIFGSLRFKTQALL